jgi:hypothetical protein
MKTSKYTVSKILHYSKLMSGDEKDKIKAAAQDQQKSNFGGVFYNNNLN